MTVSPDEAMSRLYPPAVPAVPAAGISGAPPAGHVPGVRAGLEVDVAARLAVCLDGVSSALARLADARDREQVQWSACHPFQLPTLASNAAGVCQDSDRWGPRAGWAWLVTRLTAVLAAGVTQVTFYRDAAIPSDTLLGPVGAGTWEPKGLLLLPGQQLVAAAAGAAAGGLTVTGEGVEVALHALPAFLM